MIGFLSGKGGEPPGLGQANASTATGALPFKAPPTKAQPAQFAHGANGWSESAGGGASWEAALPPAKRMKGAWEEQAQWPSKHPPAVPGGHLFPKTGGPAVSGSLPTFGALPKGAGAPPSGISASPPGLDVSPLTMPQATTPKVIPALKGSGKAMEAIQTKAPPQVSTGFESILEQNQRMLDEQQRQLQQIQERQAEEMRRKYEEEARRRDEELRQQAEELRKQSEELRKLEEQNRREEAETTAKLLHVELAELIDCSETECTQATQVAEPILDERSRKLMSDQDLIKGADSFEPARLRVLEALKACNSFMAGKHKQLMGSTEVTKKAASEFIQRIGKIERSLSTATAKVTAIKLPAKQRIDAEARREAAMLEAKRQEDIFKCFDSNGDGLLSLEDITALCKAEYNFEISDVRLEGIKNSDVFRSQQGTPFSKFAALKTQIGIARGEAQAKQRREEAAARKKVAEKQCAVVEANVAVVVECIAGIETEVRKAELKAGPLSALAGKRGLPFAVQAAETAVAEVDTAVDAAKDFIAAARERLQALHGEGKQEPLEPETQKLITKHNQNMGFRLTAYEGRLARAESLSKTARQKVELQLRKEALLREASDMQ